MRFYMIKQSIKNIRKKKFFTFITVIQINLLFLFLTPILLQLNLFNVKSSSFLGTYNNKNVYQLSDELIGEAETNYFNNPSQLDSLKKFYNALMTDESLNYMVSTEQPLEMTEFKGSRKFNYGYEEGNDLTSYENYYYIKSLQLNQNVFNTFSIPLYQGNYFEEEDYTFNESKKIPVLLGYEYNGIYSVGETFFADYLFNPCEFIVVGIIEQGTTILNVDREVLLDRYIILPQFVIQQAEDIYFEQIHYLNLINGTILSSLDPIEIKARLHDIANETNFDSFQIIGANTARLDTIFNMVSQDITINKIISVLLFVIIVITLSVALIFKFNSNIKEYTIRIVAGSSFFNLIIVEFVEILILLLLGSLLPLALFLFLKIKVSLIVITVLFLLILFLSILPFMIKLKNLNVAQILKGR